MNINLKKVISSVAALAMSLSCFTAFAADFSDVEATSTYKNAIDELVALEIVNGYEDGTFKPDNEITRAEVTKMVVAAMGPSFSAAAESSLGGSGFTDVDAAGHWASGYIAVGVAQSFINGMGDGTFAPDANVTYAQIVKMLVAALGYTTAAEYNGGYPNGYLQIGNSTGITAGVSGVSAETPVTRAQVAQLISNAIDTPLVLVTGWETNYITGEPVAKTEAMDGSNTKGEYKTLLTENHDVYKVKGRVSGTFATGASKVGMVDFDVEQSDNFEATYKIDAKKFANSVAGYSDSFTIEAYEGDVNAEVALFTYAEALVKVDENEDYTLLSLVPYGKNEIVELLADDYVTWDSTNNELEFKKSETSSRTDGYEISLDTTKLYVNGIEVADGKANGVGITSTDITLDMIQAYITANKIGTVTLIDSPAAASTSKDGIYDVIMITLPKWAIISETNVAGDSQRIYFDDFEAAFTSSVPGGSPVTTAAVGANIIIDTTDEDKVYTFIKNGEEVTFEDIAAGDIALITYDLSARAGLADIVKIELCDTVVEGAVTGSRDDDGVTAYTVNGEEYKLIPTLNALEVGYEYVLYTDAAGRVIDYEELATAKNYAVIDRVSYSTNNDAYVARLIKADGTRESVEIKATGAIKGNTSSEAHDLYNTVYGLTGGSAFTANSQINGATSTTLATVDNRVITYKINSKGELNNVEFIGGTSHTGEFTAKSNKVGSFRLSDATAIIDATAVGTTNINNTANYSASDLLSGSLDTFVDGEQYTILAADKAADGYYKFVLVLVGNASIGLNTRFAVVDSVGSATYEDGSVRYTLTVLDADSNGELVTYFYDEDQVTDPGYKRGTIMALGFNSDGTIDSANDIVLTNAFSASNTNISDYVLSYAEGNALFSALNAGAKKNIQIADWTNAGNYTGANAGNADSFFRRSPWDETADGVTTNGYARVGFGAIVARNGAEVTFVTNVTTSPSTYFTVQNDTTNDTPTPTAEQTTDNDISKYALTSSAVDFDLADDVKVYVVDLNETDSALSSRISVGSTGSITATPTVKDIDVYDSSNTVVSVYSFENADAANYAYFKVVDDEITDIVVLIPRV